MLCSSCMPLMLLQLGTHCPAQTNTPKNGVEGLQWQCGALQSFQAAQALLLLRAVPYCKTTHHPARPAVC